MKLQTEFPDVATVFLDMNGTFMFGHDRLGRDQDFYETYQTLGGFTLSKTAIQQAVIEVISRLEALYLSGLHDDNFPGVAQVVLASLGNQVDTHERLLIEHCDCHS